MQVFLPPGETLCRHVTATQQLVFAATIQKEKKSPQKLEQEFYGECREFQQEWEAFSSSLTILQQASTVSPVMIHEIVRCYLEMSQEAADLVYKGVGCYNAGMPQHWEEAQTLLHGKVALQFAIRAYGSKYARRASGLKKGPQERVLLASDQLTTDLAIPYRMADGRWTPVNWQSYIPRDAHDLRLTLHGVGRPLAVLNLDGFIRESERRFRDARAKGISPWTPSLFPLDQLLSSDIQEALLKIEQHFDVLFLSTTRADEQVHQANVDWLSTQGLWGPNRRLLLRPDHVGMRGTPWKAEIVWQEIRRLAPPVVLLGDDHLDTQEYILQQSLLEMLGSTPFIRTASTLRDLATLAERLMG